MATREDLYKQFGPLMVEALMRLVFSEINILRQRAGLSERTVQQGIDALETQLSNLSKYDWMNNQEIRNG
jgi:hypothetical protein